MLIVKPYGRSETEPDGAGGLRRKIRRNRRERPADDLDDVAAFAAGHPELVLAQWISAIDKIAAKPRGARKPTPEQRRLRETLGRAAFDLLTAEGLLDPSQEGLWRRKLHPYGKGDDRKAHGREKGRWYARFAGGRDPGAIDDEAAGEIARKICEHLHRAGYRIGGGRPDRRQGLIAARAGSIAAGVPRLPARLPGGERPRSEGDREKYTAAGDVAGHIREAAASKEKAAAERRKRTGNSLFASRDAAPGGRRPSAPPCRPRSMRCATTASPARRGGHIRSTRSSQRSIEDDRSWCCCICRPRLTSPDRRAW